MNGKSWIITKKSTLFVPSLSSLFGHPGLIIITLFAFFRPSWLPWTTSESLQGAATSTCSDLIFHDWQIHCGEKNLWLAAWAQPGIWWPLLTTIKLWKKQLGLPCHEQLITSCVAILRVKSNCIVFHLNSTLFYPPPSKLTNLWMQWFDHYLMLSTLLQVILLLISSKLLIIIIIASPNYFLKVPENIPKQLNHWNGH